MSDQELLEPPVIIINDVTYRSPHDMPDDVRAIWDGFVRQMERQEIDWRDLMRIILSRRRDGDTIRLDIQIVRHSGDFQRRARSVDTAPLREIQIQRPFHPVQSQRRWTLSRLAFLAFALGWFVLALYGLSWHAPPLVRVSGSAWLWLSFCLFCVPWALLTVSDRRLRLARNWDAAIFNKSLNPFVDTNIPAWKPTRLKLGVLTAFLALTYAAAFGGVAKLLHYVERTPGEVMSTITAKNATRSKGLRCARVKVGDRVRITGIVSSYAIEPDDIYFAR